MTRAGWVIQYRGRIMCHTIRVVLGGTFFFFFCYIYIYMIPYPMVKISPMPNSMLLICAKNRSATLRYSAEPSMLIVPIGRTNLVIFGFIFNFSSNTLNVIGRDADLKRETLFIYFLKYYRTRYAYELYRHDFYVKNKH